MNTHVEHLSHMGWEYKPKGGGKKGIGFIAVVLLHLLIGYALVSGLARKAVEVVKKPIQVAVLPEIELPPPPPPPPPPPKVEKIVEAPKVQAPPPPYVPPPDIAPPVQQTAPVIQAIQAEPPKEAPVIAPPPPPAPPAVQRAEVSVACPGYQNVLRSALQGAFEQVQIEGTVKVLIRVKGQQVVDVTPQGGPRGYYRYVQAAVRKMNCSAQGADELLVPLDVVFREE